MTTDCGFCRDTHSRCGHPAADPTEATRRDMIATGQAAADLAADAGQRWTTAEMTAAFDVRGFLAPFVVVTRKSDGATGTLEFARDGDGARYYFGWQEDAA